MSVQQAIGTSPKNPAGAAFLRDFVEEAKSSGLVARLIAHDFRRLRGSSIKTRTRYATVSLSRGLAKSTTQQRLSRDLDWLQDLPGWGAVIAKLDLLNNGFF